MRHFSRTTLAALGAALFSLPGALHSQTVTGPSIQFQTSMGNINVTLLPDSAPKTVANFLSYLNSGAYNNSVIHRSVPNFVFQGGGYQLQSDGSLLPISTNAPVVNEFGVSNTRGTMAMAKLGTDPNSATSQWFFNEVDNSKTLDTEDGGFTVFAQVSDSASLTVMDQIAAVAVPSGVYAAPLDTIPLINYTLGTVPTASNFVLINAIVQVAGSAVPAIGANGVVTASAFGGFAEATPGSFVEIYGSNLAGDTRGWGTADFVNGAAPTTLDKVSVTVGGVPAYVDYVSPSQVNIQVPASVTTGSAVPVVVTYNGVSSAAASIPINAAEPGLLAPATFKLSGTQYVAAVHTNGLFVSNGDIPNISAAPAQKGEVLVLYGVGFGAVTPTTVPLAGQIVEGLTALANPVQFKIGPNVAQVLYAGLVPGEVGLYQFNVVVPSNATSGDLLLQVTLNGTAVPQTLYLPVQ